MKRQKPTFVIIHKFSYQPSNRIKYVKYCPKLTFSKIFTTQTSNIHLQSSSLNQSNFKFTNSPQTQRQTNHLQNNYLNYTSLTSPTPVQQCKSASPGDRKISSLSYQRTQLPIESPSQKQDRAIYQVDYEDGSIYYGELNITKRQGLGALFNQQGELIYEGQWYQDKYHGVGLLINQDIVYKGEFQNGELNGQAIEESKGIKFYGFFKNGQKNGPGTIYQNEIITQAIWKNNEIQEKC